jgi:hypothetical protein
MAIIYISSQNPTSFGEHEIVGTFDFRTQESVPGPDELVAADLTLILGDLNNANQAMQLGGVLNLALPRGAVVVLAYNGNLGTAQLALLQELFSLTFTDLAGMRSAEVTHAAFTEYAMVFGRSRQFYDNLGEDIEVLMKIRHAEALFPTAFCYTRGAGAVYVIPYQTAGAGGFLASLIGAVKDHRSGATTALPFWTAELRISGEQDLLGEIDQRQTEIDDLRVRADKLSRFRHLVGSSQGMALETLIIDALSVVLEGSGYMAEDREDVGAEDFLIVGPEGDFALAESKGIGSHVRREHVNQVDNHRSAAGRDVDEFPGLLVVNIFRNTAGMGERLLPASDEVVRQADRQNVLILRGVDLYYLVSRKLAGEDAAGELIGALGAHGGWLEVTEDAAVHHRPHEPV